MSQIPLSALPEVPCSVEEAKDAIRCCARAIGGGYHPDTVGYDYVHPVGEPRHFERSFGAEAAERYDDVHEAAFALLGDAVYEIALGTVSPKIVLGETRRL